MTPKRKNTKSFTDLIGGPYAERGQSELLFLYLTFILFGLGLFYSKRAILFHQKAVQRERAYLCLKKGLDAHFSLIKKVDSSNKMILILWGAITVSRGLLYPELKPIIEILKKLQYLFLFKNMLKIFKNKKCSLEQKSLLAHYIPLKIKAFTLRIQRRIGGLALLKKKKVNFLFPSSGVLSSDFFIRGELHYTPSFALKKTREYSLAPLHDIRRGEFRSALRHLIKGNYSFGFLEKGPLLR